MIGEDMTTGRAPAASREDIVAFLQANPNVTNSHVTRHVPGAGKDRVARIRAELGIPNPYAFDPARKGVTEAEPEAVPPAVPSVPPLDMSSIPPEIAKSGMWKSLEWYQREVQKHDPRVEEATVTLPGDQPVMVCFLSDTHVGALSCDMTRLWNDLERAGRTPGFYLIAGGDLMENVVSSVSDRGSFMEQLAPPDVQKLLVEEMADLVPRDRWLAVCVGNHEAWSIRDADHDPMAYFAQHVDSVYFGAWGFLHVRTGKHVYTILAGHKFSGNSKVNKTGMVKKAMDHLGDADVVFAGHVHNYALEVTEIRRRSRIFAVAGTYLKTTRYGQSLGHSNTSPMMPAAIFFPNERRVAFTEDAFGQGIHILASFRDDVTCECQHCETKKSRKADGDAGNNE